MSAGISQPPDEEFMEADKNWELDKLYLDLASAKHKALTPVEKKLLRGLLCGCSPAEIAKRVYHSRNSNTVRVYLSNGIYKYIEDTLSQQLGYSVKLKNWSHVTHLLENAGYKKNFWSEQQVNSLIKHSSQQKKLVFRDECKTVIDWGEAVDVSNFYGRKTELNTISEWILQQDCRLVAILAMGGIGKTAFSVKLAQEIQDQFEYVIWRSLHLTPSIDILLTDLMQILSPNIEIDETITLNQRISQLIDRLRQVRCLLILDDFNSILENHNSAIKTNYSQFNQRSEIKYFSGYTGYSELIQRIGNCQHQSCLLITSREKPPELTEIEGEKLPVRSFNLTGLDINDCLSILEDKGLNTSDYTDINILIDIYGGNPQCLKLVATTIKNLFAGNIYQFLEHRNIIFGSIRRLLYQQFHRLSKLEKYILYWLVMNPAITDVFTVSSHILPVSFPKIGSRLILEILEVLQQKSYIQIKSAKILITEVWKHYIMEYLQEKELYSVTQTHYNLSITDPHFKSQLIKDLHEIIIQELDISQISSSTNSEFRVKLAVDE
ncbi:MAG: NB-ARC domain-containing protein [Nostocales cyanobacterium]|nr:MAG: NB-ARC domain-containing protein [Nostocales cyanobacterium]TAF18906.1 MAG: NB-ARC domain-containing protein [Nostocales cyanobacterium]